MGIGYIVLGAGRQGTAAAYDLARFGQAERVTLADVDEGAARAGADRVNQLLDGPRVTPTALDVRDRNAVHATLAGHTVAVSAVPYFLNLELTRVALDARVSFCDLGGNTGIVRQQHALDHDARAAGVSIVPDCGMGPGMGNTLAVHAMEQLDRAEHVRIYDGGLPLEPQPPWNYVASFSIDGLTNEYGEGMTVLRDGALVDLPPFSELESIDLPPLGTLEAFVVAGGVSTAPWTFQDRLRSYDLKILRYPGTFAHLKGFSDLGLFSLDPVTVDGQPVVPRRLFEALYEPKVRAQVVRDICIIHVRAQGEKDGRPTTVRVHLADRHDPVTGFSAMERTTGWHLSIVAAMIAHGQVAPGAVPLERAVPGGVFVAEATHRGFDITTAVETPTKAHAGLVR